MQLGKERAIGFVEEDVQAAVADAVLVADRAAADRFGAEAAPGPELEHATAG